MVSFLNAQNFDCLQFLSIYFYGSEFRPINCFNSSLLNWAAPLNRLTFFSWNLKKHFSTIVKGLDTVLGFSLAPQCSYFQWIDYNSLLPGFWSLSVVDHHNQIALGSD